MLQLLVSQMKGVGWASVLSLGLHGALAWAMLQAPAGWLGATRPNLEPVALEILAPERPPIQEVEEVPEPLPPAPHATEPSPPPPPSVASTAPRPTTPDVGPGEPEEPGPLEPPSSIEVPDIAPEPQRHELDPTSRAMRVMLDPTNVARGGFTVTGPGPSRPSGPAGLHVGRGHRTEAEIERDLQSGLRAQAMSKAHITREPVTPRRQADGSYLWAGPMFTARIAPDGEVTFRDGDDISTNGFSASGTFDLESAIMSAQGQDPRRAERERFMEETQELRDRLEDQHRREVRQRAARVMVGRLRRTWASTSHSEASRRRRIFSIWDDIADDGSMGEVRDAVIAFVRETLPEGSEHAYTAEELSALNARRQSREPFSPY